MGALKPTGDAILVDRIEKDKTAGGIIIPDMGKEPAYYGKVVAVGPGGITDKGVKVPMGIEVGQTVMYGKMCGREVEFEGQELFFIREPDVWAIVE
jgi:chaperonin GroES